MSWGGFGGVLGRFGGVLGRKMDPQHGPKLDLVLGGILERSWEAFLEVLAASWVCLGAFWGRLGASWVRFKCSWVRFGRSCGSWASTFLIFPYQWYTEGFS